MSFDELPPDSPSSRSGKTPETAQEPSAQDAPPAAPARRRRPRAAGSDAASAPESPAIEKTPVRAPRARRKTAAGEETASADTPAPIAEAPQPPAVRARASRQRAPRQAPAATESVVPNPPVAPEPVPPAPEAAKPRTARRPRGKAATGSAADSAPVPAPDIVETAEAAPAEAKPTRSRSPRARKQGAPAATTPEPSAVSIPTPSESPASQEVAPVEAEGPGRRPPRRRRSVKAAAPAEETPVAPLPDVTEPQTADEGADTQTGTRSRRNRRGSKTRTPGRRVDTAEAVTVEAKEALPAPVVEKIDRTVGAHLILRNGMAEIHINDVVIPPVLFFGNLDATANRQRVLSEVRQAAQNGIHLHSTLVELPCPLSEAAHALDEIDNRLRALLDADPEGFVMPRIVFVPARGWKREYPTEIASYADGSTGDPSLTSERFWREAEHSLATLIAHLRDYEWGKRVFGYHLERGEWFQPAEQGYDRSMANRDAFRDWLREKYGHNLVSLRAAWYDGDVQFHTADIPAINPKPNPQRAFYETRRERPTIDFCEFTSESTARRLIALAQAVKKAAHHQALVSVCYGYTFEFGHAFNGHLALGSLLASPAIDLICGPPSYRDRKPGGSASIPAPVESFPLHGKLWLSEDDTKTYLAPAKQDPEDFNPRLDDRFSTEQAQSRALGRALAHTTGIGFMDLWGEGWLDEASVWERLGGFTNRYRAFMEARQRARVPEVIALIDEKSLLHVQRGEPFFRKLTNGLHDILQRAGVSYGTYLQSDLLAPDFPTEARLYLFLTPYRLTPDQRAAIRERLQGENRTLAWLYAPGSCEERPSVGGALEEAATHIVGMSLRPQEWNSEIGSRVLEPNHPVTERLNGREIGTRERLNPSFYVDDEEALTLAEYQGSGLPSLAVKNCGTWKSVFVGDPVLPLELLRGICRYAGVHVWTPQGDDVIEIGGGWVTIHANRDGQRTLRLPDALCVYDLSEGRLVGENIREYRVFLRSGMTRTFCVGPMERLERLGLPNLALPARDRPKLPLEPLPERPTRREPTPLPKARTSDLETLEAVLNMDISALETTEAEALEEDADEDTLEEEGEDEGAAASLLETGTEGELMANGRRRRRRGGRGRGRRRPGDSLTEGLAADAALPEVAGGQPDATGEGEDAIPFPPFPVLPEEPRPRSSFPLFAFPDETEEGAEKEPGHAESAAEPEGDAGL